MKRRALPAGTDIAVTALAALTTFLTLLSWQVLAVDSSAYLLPLFWFCVVIGASGLALRTLRTPRLVIPLVQLAGTVLVINHWWAPLGPVAGWVPTWVSVQQVITVLELAVEEASSYAAPVPAEAVAFWPMLVGAGCLLALGVDFLACTLRRIPLAGLPLLAGFTAPVSIVGGVSWLTFALAALAFVFLLTADQATRLGQWGRNLAGAPMVVDNQPHEVRLGTLWPTSARIGLAGVGLAVLAPAVLPAGQGLLNGGGIGGVGGGDEVTISDPLVDMRRRLTRGSDVPLVRVETDDPAPSYLRTSVLDEFNGTAWTPSRRDIPSTNRVEGPMPAPPGLDRDTPRVVRESSLSITDELNSTWLPTPYPATVVDVPGDWRYDEDTLDLVSIEGANTRGLEYDVVGLELDPDPQALVSALPPPRSILTDGVKLPDNMPDWITDLAAGLTSEARSPFERAVVLQEWFRETGDFSYSLERASGSGLEQLERFLGTGEGSRVGYCEQFASAMAMMARSVGVPARVAVGFLRPDPAPDGSWVYSSYDLHSWPELYFEGAGWIRFEPTPQDRTSDAIPTYTAGQVPDPQALPNPSTSTAPQEPRPSRADEEAAAAGSGATADDSPVGQWTGFAGVVLLVLAGVAAPRGLRGWARRRRYAGNDPREVAEGAWSEVRATALDLRHDWADGTTTRQQALGLVPALGSEPLEPLESLALLVERARYSGAGLTEDECGEVRAQAGVVTTAMLTTAEPSVRRRATWVPASLWRGRRGDFRASQRSDRRRWMRTERLSGAGATTGGERTDLERVSL